MCSSYDDYKMTNQVTSGEPRKIAGEWRMENDGAYASRLQYYTKT